MYNLPYHKAQNEDEAEAFVRQYPFAFLSGCDPEGKPVATQVPLLLDNRAGKWFLRGHVMRHTDHHAAFLRNPHVLAVFSGRHCYVSGSWYSNPNTASTWNYMSVHAQGAIRFLDEGELEELMRATTLHFENNDPRSPTVYDNLPSDFKRWALPVIAGFEIEVAAVETVFKLSQDRDAKSYRNIIGRLREQGEDGRVIAAEMERREEALFGG